MDDFAKLMGEQGVRPLDERPRKPFKPATRPAARSTAAPQPAMPPVAAPPAPAEAAPPDPAPVAWAAGKGAADVIHRALTKCLVERGRITFIIHSADGVDAVNVRLHATIGELAAAADRARADLVIIEGRGWKTIMHPASGVATITQDPED